MCKASKADGEQDVAKWLKSETNSEKKRSFQAETESTDEFV